MIRLTRINHQPLVLNADLIEHIETTHDTVITMTTGQKFVVLETSEQILERVVEFRRTIAEAVGHALGYTMSAPRPIGGGGSVTGPADGGEIGVSD